MITVITNYFKRVKIQVQFFFAVTYFVVALRGVCVL